MKFFKNKKHFIAIAVLVLILAFIVYVISFSSDGISNETISNAGTDEIYEVFDSEVLKISDSELYIGDKNAKVSLVDYASMSCPHCAAFYDEAFDKIKKNYIDTGKVKFVYRDFPLNHPSLVAATIAICRAYEFDEDDRAEKYHEFVKTFYDTQNSWIFKNDYVAKLESIAILDGMSKSLVKKCLIDQGLQDRVLKARMLAAKELDIQSTPTFFVNNRKIQGFVGYKEIAELIDDELSK